MADNVLDSYFVKVSAAADTNSFNKLAITLKEASGLVDNFATKSIRNIVGIEVAAVGAFSAIGLGIIALADKTAITDQSYRLFGLHMLMNVQSSRAMKQALDELGATLDEVAYDPELNKRFQYLYEQNMKLGEGLGKNFERNMRGIRDLRMEYKMFGNEFEYLIGGVISNMYEKLGFGSEDVFDKLQNINDWFTSNLPEMSDEVSNRLLPVWNDFKVVVKDSGGELKTFAGDFTYVSGILLGDKSIQNTEFNVQNLTKALQDWLDLLAKITLSMGLFGKTAGHIITGAAAGAAGLYETFTGHPKEADRFFDTADKEGQAGFNNFNEFFYGFIPGDKYQYDWEKNPDYAGFLALGKSQIGDPNQPDTSDFGPAFNKNFDYSKSVTPQNQAWLGKGTGAYSLSTLPSILDTYGKQFNVNPELLAAIIKNESDFNATAASGKSTAQGLMQLLKGTREQYGVQNGFNPEENVKGGAHYLHDLLNKYNNNVVLALAAYKAGPGNVDKAHGIPDQATEDYVSKVLRDFSTLSREHTAGGPVTIGTVNISVPHALPDDKWKDFVHESMHNLIVKNTRNTTAQTAGGAYF